MQEPLKTAVLTWQRKAKKAFTSHPEATSETYTQHLWFTVKMSARFAYTSAAIMLHGLFPFLCTRTASLQMGKINRIMKHRTQPNSKKRIAIIGGGFCGSLVLANIVKAVQTPLIIEWFEPNEVGEGVAYSTQNPKHLLNVRADRMGAFSNHPTHFYEWLKSDKGKRVASDLWPNHTIDEQSFVPRLVYSAYVKDCIAQAKQEALSKEIIINYHNAAVTNIELHDPSTGELLLNCHVNGAKEEMKVNIAVLATGNLPPGTHGFMKGLNNATDSYIHDVWKARDNEVYPDNVEKLSEDSNIVILGTGLTMIDTVMTLKSHGYKGTITAISRSGLLPAAHESTKLYKGWDWIENPQSAPRTALELLKGLRKEIKNAQAQGCHWQAVIDALRPVTQTLWKQLDDQQKKVFFKRLSTFWNIHRHRMAPEIHKEILALTLSEALKIHSGRILNMMPETEGICIHYKTRGSQEISELHASLVLNCTGSDLNIAATQHSLLSKMREQELISANTMRAGIEITSTFSAKGKAEESLFAIGTLMTGALLESTAVPELRNQAFEVANNVLARVKALQQS